MVKLFFELHGDCVEVTSERWEGSKFTMVLPPKGTGEG
jgi:hypothetical protein